MRAAAERVSVAGAAGRIEVAASIPESPRAVAVVAHPHPLYGGTMDNKVVTTVARAFADRGAATVRFNFRGVGGTEGAHDEGRGEACAETATSMRPAPPSTRTRSRDGPIRS